MVGGVQTRPLLTSLLLFCIILGMANAAAYVPLKSTYWGSYQYTVFYSNGSNMVGPTSPEYYSIPFTDQVAEVLQISAVLATYSFSQTDFGFVIATPTFDNVTQTANLSVQIQSGSTFSFLKFFIVYNTPACADYFEINVLSATTTVANGAVGSSKTEGLSSTTRLSVAGGDTTDIVVMLSSIVMSVGASNPYEFTLNSPAPTLSGNSLSMTLATTASISSLMVTTFIVKTNLLPEEELYQKQVSVTVDANNLAATLCTNNFNLATDYGDSFDRNCSLGLTAMRDDFNVIKPRAIDFDASGTGFTNCSNSVNGNGALSFSDVVYGSYCMVTASCATDHYFNLTSADCQACSLHDADCIVCNITVCSRCNVNFYPSGTSCSACALTNCTYCLTAATCAQCTNSSYVDPGTNVCTTCANLANCILCSDYQTCIECDTNYGVNATGLCSTCASMIDGCNTCSSNILCSECASTHFLAFSNTSCVICSAVIDFCEECTESTDCTLCATGYYKADNITCTFCGVAISFCGSCTNGSLCDSCQLGYYLDGNGTACTACPIAGCLNCTDAATCVECQGGYYLSGSTCIQCSTDHCINCPNSTTCLACDTDFELTNSNTTCSCISGWEVTDVCVSVTGCATAVKISSVATCLFCNAVDHFALNGSICSCRQGYSQSGSSCLTVCGDGLVLGTEGCDDGNTASGDGCASDCTTETDYVCGINSAGYRCVYQPTFSIVASYINRLMDSNTAEFVFSIQPGIENLNNMDFHSLFTLTVDTSTVSSSRATAYSVDNIYYSSSKVNAVVSFTQNLQGATVTLGANFDPTWFNSGNSTVSLTARGTNAALITSENGSHSQYLQTISYVELGLGVVILLLAIVYQKMVAIETFNTVQIMVLSKLLFEQNEVLVSWGVYNLKYFNGYNQLGHDLTETNKLTLSYSRLLFNNDFILNFTTFLALILVALLIALVTALYRTRVLYSFRSNAKASVDEYRLLKQAMDDNAHFVWERVIFVVACITLLQCCAAVRVQSRALNGTTQQNYFIFNLVACVFSLGYILGVILTEVMNIGRPHQHRPYNSQHAPNYIGYHLIFLLVTAPVLVTADVLTDNNAIFVIGAVVLTHLITFMVWRPYERCLHNFSVTFNLLSLLAFLAIQAAFDKMSLTSSVELIASYAVMFMVLVMEVLALARIWLARKPKPKDKQRMKSREEKEEKEKDPQQMEKEALKKRKKKMLDESSRRQREESQALQRIRSRLKEQFRKNVAYNEQLI